MKRIAYKNLPATWPITPTIVFWLLLDRIGVGDVAWGVFYTLAAIVWVTVAVVVFNTEQVDVL